MPWTRRGRILTWLIAIICRRYSTIITTIKISELWNATQNSNSNRNKDASTTTKSRLSCEIRGSRWRRRVNSATKDHSWRVTVTPQATRLLKTVQSRSKTAFRGEIRTWMLHSESPLTSIQWPRRRRSSSNPMESQRFQSRLILWIRLRDPITKMQMMKKETAVLVASLLLEQKGCEIIFLRPRGQVKECNRLHWLWRKMRTSPRTNWLKELWMLKREIFHNQRITITATFFSQERPNCNHGNLKRLSSHTYLSNRLIKVWEYNSAKRSLKPMDKRIISKYQRSNKSTWTWNTTTQSSLSTNW